MLYPDGFLQAHPVAPDAAALLGLNGYQLRMEIAGLGLCSADKQLFIAFADGPAGPSADQAATVTHVVLHLRKPRGEADIQTFVCLTAALARLRLTGYDLRALPDDPVYSGVRSRAELHVIDPLEGKIVLVIPAKQNGGFFGGGARSAPGMLHIARALAPLSTPPAADEPERLYQYLLAAAICDPRLPGQRAADVAARAYELIRLNRTLAADEALTAAGQLLA